MNQTVYVDRPVPVYVTQNITKYVDRIVTVNQTVEVPVYIYQTITQYVYTGNLTTFKTINDVRLWLDRWQYKPNPDFIEVAPGIMEFDPQANDCNHYSMQMVKDGVHDGYFFGLVIPRGVGHCLVFTLIGNDISFIEPQTKALFNVLDDSYWKVDK